MARIVYGVMGDSRGHLSRALAVAESLPEHEFLFVGGQMALSLRDEGHSVCEAPAMSTFIEQGRVRVCSTLLNGIGVWTRRGATIDRLCREIAGFAPQLALTDYEHFTPYAARRLGIKCLSLDNQHVLTLAGAQAPGPQGLSRLATCLAVRGLYSAADRYLITSFYPFVSSGLEGAEFFPPLLRPRLRELKQSDQGYGLVYLRGGARPGLLEKLSGLGRPLRVYGLEERADLAAIKFRRFSVQGFLDDLAGCSYVICNAGHSLLSESFFLGKPAFCLPVPGFHEQLVNSLLAVKAGFGELVRDIDGFSRLFEDFYARLGYYRENLGKNNFWGNDKLAARLRDILAETGLRSGLST